MNNNELYHHGVLGMRWGVRRYQPYSEVPRGSGKRGKEIGDARRINRKENTRIAKENYKKARAEYKSAVKARRSNSFIVKAENAKKYKSQNAAIERAEVKKRKAKGDLALAKGGVKAEKRYYSKQFMKTGLPGSAKDAENNHAGDKLFDQLVKDKGQAYAEDVFRKTKNQAVAAAIAGSALMIGSTAVQTYLLYKES